MEMVRAPRPEHLCCDGFMGIGEVRASIPWVLFHRLGVQLYKTMIFVKRAYDLS